MLRVLTRFTGLLLLACAFAALIVDGTRSLAADAIVVTPLGEALATFLPARLAGLEASLRGLHPLVWTPVATTLLRLPVWLASGLAGGVLFAVTARRRTPIGFSSR